MIKKRIHTENEILGVLYLLEQIKKKNPVFFTSGHSTSRLLEEHTEYYTNHGELKVSQRTFQRLLNLKESPSPLSYATLDKVVTCFTHEVITDTKGEEVKVKTFKKYVEASIQKIENSNLATSDELKTILERLNNDKTKSQQGNISNEILPESKEGSLLTDSLMNSDNLLNTTYNILKELFPKLKLSQKDNPHQLHTLDLQEENIEFAFTILSSFENYESLKETFNDLIKKIKKDNKQIFTYVVIVKVKRFDENFQQFIDEIIVELENKKIKGELERGALLEYMNFYDCENFTKYIQRSTDIYLRNVILEVNQKMRNEFQERMDQQFYLESVPYTQQKKIEYNPSDFLQNKITENITGLEEFNYAIGNKGKHTQAKWFFILSEFGFGKTSLLLKMYEKLGDDIISIFIPMAQLRKETFNSKEDFIEDLFRVILDTQIEKDNVFHYLVVDVLSDMIMNRGDIILMFDGLDEYTYAYEMNCQKKIFQTLSRFNISCVFSLREEFWNERQGMLEISLLKKEEYKGNIALKAWSDTDILNFLNMLENKNSNIKNLHEFRQYVEKGNYHQYCGDIPKRPLFLQMLIQDMKDGDFKKKTLADLYEKYLIKKFFIDRSGVFEKNELSKILNTNKEKDIIAIAEDIFRILEHVSFKMAYNNEENELIFRSDITEKEINRHIGFYQLESYKVSEILMNSVLIPFEKRSSLGFRLRFAHKSFQEYFFSRYVFNMLLSPGGDQQSYDFFKFKAEKSIVNFVEGLLSTRKTSEIFNLLHLVNNSLSGTDEESLIRKIIERL